MRVSDRSLLNTYIRNMNNTKADMASLQEKITTGKSINKPSDSPLGASRVMRLSSQMNNVATYSANIEKASSIMNGTISSMTGIQTEIGKIISDLTFAQNPTLGDTISSYSRKIDSSLNQILDLANSDFDGQYLFGGTDHSTKPFALNGTSTGVDVQSSNLGGERKIRISKNIDQKINITGKELFQSVLTQSGTLDSTAAGGSTTSTSKTVYDSDGNQYTFVTNYQKDASAANTYNISYTLDDGSGAGPQSVGSTNVAVFDSSSGELKTIDGSNPKDIHIQANSNKVDFVIDISSLKEGSSNSVSSDLSQKANIFNTIISIKNNLKNGILPNANQIAIVNDFNQHILNKLSTAGDISNRLTSTSQLLDNQTLELTDLKSQESDVDIVKAMVELQSKQFNLDTGYKISAMILPKSLVDFL